MNRLDKKRFRPATLLSHLLTISARYVRFEKLKYRYMSRKTSTSTFYVYSWIYTALNTTSSVRAEVGLAEQYLYPGCLEIGQ